MKIAHLNTEKTFRGGERQVIFLMEGLVANNIDNYLICNTDAKIKERAINFMDANKIFEVSMNGEFDLIAVLKIRKFLKQNQIDIVHCHTSHAHTLGYFAAMGLDTKVLISRRVDFSIHRSGIRFLSSVKYNKMCDRIISISDTIKEILINDGVKSEKIIPVHSGVEPFPIIEYEKYKPLMEQFKIPENVVKIVNVAALEHHKGQHYLLNAFAEVLKKEKNIVLIIVGDGKLRDKLKMLAKELRIDKNVIFTGFRNDVPMFVNMADIFVMASLDEGLCTSILDALTLNKVVVATNAGGIPEIIKDEKTGILVEKGNVNALAQGLIKAVKNLEFYKDKFKNGKQFIMDNFSVEKMVEGNIKVYKEMLNK